MGKLAVHVATDRLTATWQLSCFPVCPQYCRATPTEWVPFFGRPVSSTIQAATGLVLVIAARAHSRACSPAAPGRSKEHRPLHGATTGACAGRFPEPVAPP